MNIPFLDLKTQGVALRTPIERELGDILDSGWYVLGPKVDAFEAAFAEYCGVQHAVAVNSGTAAVHLALLAAGIGAGDEVITVSHTFIATVAPILHVGARPVLVDVDPETYTLDPQALDAAITERTRAIMPVHLYGQPADMDPILAIARERGLVVIEDACQAHGARYRGRPVGSLGDLACFSFYPGKNLGAYGEGGAVVTDDEQLARRLCRLRDHGSESKYIHVEPGFNYRMEAFQGAVLGVKLPHLEEWNSRRIERAQWYEELLQGLPVATPTRAPYARHVFHLYVIESGDRDGLREFLAERGVSTGIHYPVPVHLQPGFSGLVDCTSLPVTETVTERILSLPMYPELTRPQVEAVARAVEQWCRIPAIASPSS